MTSIVLIRHGQTDWNIEGLVQGTTDNPLNATGRGQAATVASSLQTIEWTRDWDGVVSSPLVRASETAAVIADVLGVPFEALLPDLRERDYGDAEGLNVDDASRLYSDHVYPRSEAKAAVAERGLAALARLHRDHAGRHLIAVTHGGLLQSMLSNIHGAPTGPILNATINIVERSAANDGWKIVTINNEAWST